MMALPDTVWAVFYRYADELRWYREGVYMKRESAERAAEDLRESLAPGEVVVLVLAFDRRAEVPT